MAKIFTLEEYMKDENGEFVRKLKGGSEPEVKFSNLEKESSILEDEDSGEDEEEELDALFFLTPALALVDFVVVVEFAFRFVRVCS